MSDSSAVALGSARRRQKQTPALTISAGASPHMWSNRAAAAPFRTASAAGTLTCSIIGVPTLAAAPTLESSPAAPLATLNVNFTATLESGSTGHEGLLSPRPGLHFGTTYGRSSEALTVSLRDVTCAQKLLGAWQRSDASACTAPSISACCNAQVWRDEGGREGDKDYAHALNRPPPVHKRKAQRRRRTTGRTTAM